jgi:hypothetical protein
MLLSCPGTGSNQCWDAHQRCVARQHRGFVYKIPDFDVNQLRMGNYTHVAVPSAGRSSIRECNRLKHALIGARCRPTSGGQRCPSEDKRSPPCRTVPLLSTSFVGK